MPTPPKQLAPDQIIQELSRLFMVPAHDRHVYCVFGPYAQIHELQRRIRQEAEAGSFNSQFGQVEYISLGADLFAHLKQTGKYDIAAKLADNNRDQQLKTALSDAFRDLVTHRIENPAVSGVFIADFELLYAYDLGGNDLSIARQVAINGKRVCLLVPGRMHDGRLWIFDEDGESRQMFPDTLLFLNSGWVFELN